MIAAIALTALLGALPAAAPATELPALQREASADAAELTECREPLRAALLLFRLEELLPHLGPVVEPLRAADAAATRFASEARLNPKGPAGEVAALAERVGLLLELARGRPARAAEREAKLRLPSSWAILSTTWAPGGSCGVGGPVPAFEPSGAGGTEPRWRALRGIARAGRLDLDDLLPERRNAAAVVAITVTVDRPSETAVYYGASGPSALAVDGAWIEADPAHHPSRDDQLRVPLELSAGPHLLEVELCRADRPLLLSLRVAAASGAPLPHAQLGLPPLSSLNPGPKMAAARAARTPRQRPPVAPERGGRLLAAALAHEDPASLDAAAAVREALDPADASEHAPTLARQKACEAEPAQTCLLRLAQDEERDHRPIDRQEALARATATGPLTAELALEEGRQALDLGYPDRALRHALEAERLDPNDDRPLLQHAQALEALGETFEAARLELGAASRWPYSPDAQMASAYRLERLGRRRQAIRQLRVLLGLRPDLLGARESLQRLLLAVGDLDGALEQNAAEQQLVPASARPLVERGRLLLANPLPGPAGVERRARAQEDLRAALALAPDSSDIASSVAAAELSDGDRALGRTALRRALALRPQSHALRALDRQLTERRDPFADAYLADLVQTARAVPPTPGEDAVVLSDATVIEVYPSGLASRVHQTLVRVQTDRGAEAARTTSIELDPARQDLQIEAARILEPDGRIVSTYEESSRSLSEPWYDLYYDHREHDVTFPGLAAGDVVELTYRLDDTARENLAFDEFGDITFLQDTVDRAHFTYAVQMPAGRELYANAPKVAGLSFSLRPLPGGGHAYTWTLGKIGKLRPEPQMPGWAEVAPYLHVSTQESWAEVGDSYWNLVRDQLAPSSQLQSLARSLAAASGPEPQARVKAAYDYVVSQTRYVGLEFGIHGYKPYSVGEVLSRGFGDCKDKASLLWALLRELGVDSRLVLLRTRRLGRIGAEPASLAVFDHAILYVPSLDRFLDGTARFFGSTELPPEDQGASALIVEPGGKSRLGTTPFVPAGENVTATDMLVQLAPDGSATLHGNATVSGSQAADYRRSYQSEAGRRAVFEQGWSRSYPGLTVQSVRFTSALASLEQPVGMDFDLSVPHFGQRSGASWTFDPFGAGATYLETYATLSRRDFALALPPPSSTRFRYRCAAPPGGRFAAPPPDVALEAPFGRLRIHYGLLPPDPGGARQLEVVGELELTAPRIEPESYLDFRRFLERTDRAFSQPLTLEAPGRLDASAR
ncbi:MAG: DUF3857 domain-containing protein [Myxococcales bacterium]